MMFYVTVSFLMPNARVAIRHLITNVMVDDVRTRVKGFRVLVSEGQVQLAMHAILLAEPSNP